MISLFRLTGALLAICLLTAAPVPAQDTRAADGGATTTEDRPEATPDGEAGQVSLADDIATDARIAERIRGILIELDGYEAVDVTVRSGIVTLTGEVLDANALARLETLVAGIDGVLTVQNEVVETTDLAKRLNPAAERMLVRLRQGAAALPLLLVALTVAGAILAIGLLLARLQRPWDRIAPNAFIADIYRQIVRLVFAVAGIVVALDILNATALLGTILGAAGIIGLAIGFAVRDTVENFIASVMLSIRQPFQPNDAVEIDGDQGKVIRLTSRATILLSFDGNHIRIPNATVFKSRIVNFTRNAERRFQFSLPVAPDSDLAAVRSLMEETVAALPFTLEQPGISVWIEGLTDRGVEFTVTGWIDQRTTSLLRARGEAFRLVKAAVEASGVRVPEATYGLRLDGDVGLPEVTAPAPARPGPVGPLPGAPVAADVDAKDDVALEEMIAHERRDEANPDLLRREAPTE
ncbi:mechanosensitive ion channel domain-containing protein [Oceaniglobus roseus]|uniref:mechanosensitive ion channel domain-containing protein n=1 Tax=Oceaniglobus roseus TaxID=1737570 RepID=UPI000C7F21AF|nr:mechanosensitive ion channel domain-containing protein [Kandeliimicrobium roseum]